MQKGQKRDELHPYTATLTHSHLASCCALEDAAFPAGQRGSREKFEYRLTTCGELSMGLFTSSTDHSSAATAATATVVDSAEPDRKELLLAMVVATKTRNILVTDADMTVPDDWRSRPSIISDEEPVVGHQEDGRTIAIHSLAVEPSHQRRGLGRTLLKAYIQRVQASDIADRISILTYERLIPFYEALGFEKRGASKAEYGGGGWIDMVIGFLPSCPRLSSSY
ncbi:acyl-CoA N-acyltransferase [Saccharata proteae CBS 121410]|uniref:Acyl-CoA N-acyltransferase n=1 Tax=Saccharata proteae CBS 121410 TaxID=1314787 RepID=A0A9P4I0Y4_9PEZI|nr:acyl-CoA N-acyltransferase [Saccharata proteae CBS 121410]